VFGAILADRPLGAQLEDLEASHRDLDHYQLDEHHHDREIEELQTCERKV